MKVLIILCSVALSFAAHSPATAICHLKPESGLCRAYFPRYYYNAESRTCEKFVYGGCGGNANNFETFKECEKTCVNSPVPEYTQSTCEQEAATGPCFGYFTRYYYDKVEGVCKKFVYGGCQGNDNNFNDLESCERTCGNHNEDVCSLEKVVGPCKAAIPRVYFNQDTGKCESFIYGGCRGNGNNFATVELCEETCLSPRAQDVCSLEKVVGPCRAAFRRF